MEIRAVRIKQMSLKVKVELSEPFNKGLKNAFADLMAEYELNVHYDSYIDSTNVYIVYDGEATDSGLVIDYIERLAVGILTDYCKIQSKADKLYKKFKHNIEVV